MMCRRVRCAHAAGCVKRALPAVAKVDLELVMTNIYEHGRDDRRGKCESNYNRLWSSAKQYLVALVTVYITNIFKHIKCSDCIINDS